MAPRVVDLRKGRPAPSRVRPLPFPSASPPRRPTPLRSRRRKARAIVFALVLLLAAAIAYGVHLLSYAPQLTIQSVRVSGAENIDPVIIESYVDSSLSDGSFRYFSRRNIFLYPKEAIESGIVASFPRVKNAHLSRGDILSTALGVAIEERTPHALWCEGVGAQASTSPCYAMDDGGFIFAEVATSTRGGFQTPYVFSGGLGENPVGEMFVPGQLPPLFALLRILQQETNLIPNRVDVLRDQDFNVTLEQGFFIKASFGQEPLALARNLELALSSDALRNRLSDIEYIDLRFGNRVYYKMKGEEQANI